jgi:hypothetical protein
MQIRKWKRGWMAVLTSLLYMEVYIVDHFISNEESLNVKRPTWNEGHCPGVRG